MKADIWATIAMIAVVVGSASPILFGMVSPRIPYLVWLALFVVMLTTFLLSFVLEGRGPWPHLTFYLGVVTAWFLLITAVGGAGFFPIVIVGIAAVSVYVTTSLATVIIIAGNTLVLAIATVLGSSELREILLGTGLYLILQIGTAMSAHAILSEQRMRKQLTEANIELQGTSVLLEESTRTAERLRISRDLHDSIGHKLTVLSLELEAARHSDDTASREHVQKASAVAREVLGDLRSTVSEMRTDSGDLGNAIRGVVDNVPGIRVQVTIEQGFRVSPDAQEVLLRAVQELATNTLRHANASELNIQVARDARGGVALHARDDGVGSGKPVPGNGLRGMIERFEALGGSVALEGSNGFSVTATLPSAHEKTPA